MTALTEATLAAPQINLVYVAWLDFDGDPLRATTFPGGLAFGASDTGDADLDGETFIHVPAPLVSVSAVAHGVGGSDTVTATLSGLPGPDDDLLAIIADTAKWQGRVGRLWHGTHDGAGGSLTLSPYYTGYMVQAELSGDPSSGGAITIVLENYLASLTEPRNRTYQDQQRYDPLDKVAARIRAAANGVKGTGGPGMSFGGSGNGARDLIPLGDAVLK